jgi:hypothetical protein
MTEATSALPERKDFAERLQSLFRMDCIRVSRILETAQYAVLFGILTLIVGFGIDCLFRPLYPVVPKEEKLHGKRTLQVVGIILLQIMVSAVSVLYIRKVADIVPFVFEICPSRYIPHYKVKEIEGEIAIALAFVGIQTSLIDNLAKLRQSYFYTGDA